MLKNKGAKELCKQIWRKSSGICAHCGRKVDAESDRTIDHVIPRSLGGTDDQRNLMPLCKTCNKGRGTNKIEVAEYYSFASGWALDEFRDYLMEWKMERSDVSGEIFVDANQWVF